MREGALLARVVGALPERPAVLLVNGTGRDHPRGAGLAVHLGAVLDLATVGVTDRPLVATGADPGPDRGATAPLVLDGDVVAQWVRTRAGVRPVVAHAGWGTDPDTATRLLLETAHRARTPEPTRRARELARRARTRGSYS